jgi:hypothetical protein
LLAKFTYSSILFWQSSPSPLREADNYEISKTIGLISSSEYYYLIGDVGYF